ncbi:MAG: primosomal protein N', partial [Alphaproteobacteria bacterium]|nr:primosomal protein N' [Alphaproteobacteria bacterium]
MALYRILTSHPRMKPLTYKAPDDWILARGDLVKVPLGGRDIAGVVMEGLDADTNTIPESKIRSVSARYDLPALQDALLRLIEWTAHYYVAEQSAVLRMVLAGGIGLELPKRARKSRDWDADPAQKSPGVPCLSAQQDAAADRLRHAVNASAFAAFSLYGVTGSGKTEVYFEAVASTLAQGRQALVLLPEIALTVPFLSRFEARFGAMPCAWHSQLTPAARREAFRSIALGHAPVVIGARSALFLPYKNLGVIV